MRIRRPGEGRIEEAAYRDPAVAEYRGNPLIEALPPIHSEDEARAALASYPVYDPHLRSDPKHLRFHHIQSTLSLFVVLPMHMELERRFSICIRQGLISRNPTGADWWRGVHERADAFAGAHSYRSWSRAVGFGLLGISGMGKSVSTEAVLDLYPQVILHKDVGSELSLAQIVWLKLECPHDGSIKGLCLDFFASIDRLLGTEYARTYGGVRRTVDDMKPGMALVASAHALGVLVIDEIQRLSPFKSGGPTRMIDFLVQLINTIGVPIVLIGTPKARSIFEREFRIIRRASGQGDLIWDRMHEDATWRFFLEFLWRYQYTKTDSQLTDEMSQTLYYETQGIVDLGVKLYLLAQVRAILSGKERITPAIVKSAARDHLRLAQPVLKALRSGKAAEIAPYDDIDALDFDRAFANESESARTVTAAATSVSDSVEQPPEEKAEPEKGPTQPKPRKRVGVAKKARKAPEDLREIVEAGASKGRASYESLRLAGYLRPADEFLGVSKS
jgi:hypothetical protein